MSESKQASAPKTLVEEGTQLKGSITSKCPIEVKGRIEGDLQAPSLTVSLTGAVHGKVKVGEIRSEGELCGEFDADVVRLSGSVKDNTIVRAKSLEVKLASAGGRMQVMFGECALEIGDMPVREEQPAKREVVKTKEREKAAEKAIEKIEKIDKSGDKPAEKPAEKAPEVTVSASVDRAWSAPPPKEPASVPPPAIDHPSVPPPMSTHGSVPPPPNGAI